MIIVNKSVADLAEGVRIPTTVKPAQDFLLDQVKDYKYKEDNDIKQAMKLCNNLYKYEGTCGTAIDIFVEFAITKVSAEETGNKKLDNILEYFNRQVNQNITSTLRGMQAVLNKIGLDWFIKGNAFPYVSWDDVDLPNFPAPVKLPVKIICLNPELINIPPETQMIGNAKLFYQPTMDMINMLGKDGRSLPGLKNLKDMLGKGGHNGYPLNPKFIRHIKRKGRDYSAWGIPYLTKAFSAVASIRRLRRLDDATTEGLVNLVTVYKIGTEDKPASYGRLLAFKSLIQNPTPTQTLVWGHDVDVQQVGPDGRLLSFDKKYVEPTQELLRALGIPAILIDPNLNKGGDPWASILALAERLQKFRDELQIWVEDIYRQIAENNEFEDIYPKARWQRMNLTNDQALKNLVMQFYDRGLIDPETALMESGYDFSTVLNRKKRHQSANIAELFRPPKLPFGGSIEDKGRPQKGSPKDKPKDKDKKPAVDMQPQKKPASPKAPKTKETKAIDLDNKGA